MKSMALMVGALAAFCAAGASTAMAKPARCFTTDDGHYPCDFKGLDRQGSFEIKAKGFPTYTLWIESPGTAAGFVNFGDRNVALPGTFRREAADRACWANDETQTRICVW